MSEGVSFAAEVQGGDLSMSQLVLTVFIHREQRAEEGRCQLKLCDLVLVDGIFKLIGGWFCAPHIIQKTCRKKVEAKR